MAGYTVEEAYKHIKEDNPEYAQSIDVANKIATIIGDLITARNQKGLTQKELAEIAGVKQSAIARMESMRVIPRLDTILNIAYSLGVDIGISKNENSNSCFYTVFLPLPSNMGVPYDYTQNQIICKNNNGIFGGAYNG